MTVNEIAHFVCDTAGDTSAGMLDFTKRAIRLKYKSSVYPFHTWRESLRTVEGLRLNPDLNGVFFLPYDAEEVIFLSLSMDGVNYTRLLYRERDWLERFACANYSLPGNVPTYAKGENLAWPYLNPGRLTFTSNDPAIFTVYVAGLDYNNFPVDETYTMQAAVNPDTTVNPAIITTVNSFSKVTMLTKGHTGRSMGITSEFPSAPLSLDPTPISVQLPASTSELTFTQLILTPPPILVNDDGSVRNIYVRGQFKLKPDPLESDGATPRVSHGLDGLIEFTLAAVYKRLHQLSKADDSEKRAAGHLQAAINVEKNQGESFQQVIPVIYERGDYLAATVANTSSFPFGG